MKKLCLILLGVALLTTPKAMAQGVEFILAKSQADTTQANLLNISTALTVGYYSRGDYYLPAAGEDFNKWLLLYTDNPKERVDAWGNDFNYQATETGFELRSAGPDGIFNNDDDKVVKGP